MATLYTKEIKPSATDYDKEPKPVVGSSVKWSDMIGISWESLLNVRWAELVGVSYTKETKPSATGYTKESKP